MTGQAIAQPRGGDLLLYAGRGPIAWWIKVKTWSGVSHCEVALDDRRSVASRDGIGVGRYARRYDDLAYLLRPWRPINLDAGERWFATVDGQRYDWLGLLVFYLAAKQGARDRMFCSEFATRFYRACGLEPFTERMDADRVAPATFLYTPRFVEVWRRPDMERKA